MLIRIPGKPKPKPAGCIKYRGNMPFISMDKNGYKAWQENVVRYIVFNFYNPTPITPYGIIYIICVPNLKGLGDVTNIMEALQDALVKAKVIKDDRPGILKNVSVTLKLADDYCSFIHLCYNKQEYIQKLIEVL